MKLSALITKQAQISELFKRHNFDKPLIYKDFYPTQNHCLNILVDDLLPDSTTQSHRRMKLEYQLKKLLKCKVEVGIRNYDPFDQEDLDDINASDPIYFPPNDIENNERNGLLIKLTEHFGDNWEFAPYNQGSMDRVPEDLKDISDILRIEEKSLPSTTVFFKNNYQNQAGKGSFPSSSSSNKRKAAATDMITPKPTETDRILVNNCKIRS